MDETEVVQIPAEQARFLDNFATHLHVNNEDWYFCPFYFKKNKNGTVEVIPFQEIPKYLIDHIKSERGDT